MKRKKGNDDSNNANKNNNTTEIHGLVIGEGTWRNARL